MGRFGLLSLPVGLLGLVALSGCSGVGKYEADTLTLPGANPNLPAGMTETMNRVEAKPVTAGTLQPEPGNVWPGQPKPFPTLGEVEKETQGNDSATPPSSGNGSGYAPVSGAVPPISGSKSFEMHSNPNAASTITIPNGNGTSTVIAPDGSVRVIPTPGATPAAPAPASGTGR